jgi:hypothetical protein
MTDLNLVCFLFVAFYGFTWANWYARESSVPTMAPAMAGH